MWSVATFICTEVAEKEDALVCGRRRPTLAGHQAQFFVATGCALVRNVAAMGPPHWPLFRLIHHSQVASILALASDMCCRLHFEQVSNMVNSYESAIAIAIVCV